jgi:hypothetical protein
LVAVAHGGGQAGLNQGVEDDGVHAGLEVS